MARREGGGPGALIEQRAGPGGYHSAALVEPARHLLPRLLQPGRGDQLETEDSGARFQRKGNSPIQNTMLWHRFNYIYMVLQFYPLSYLLEYASCPVFC